MWRGRFRNVTFFSLKLNVNGERFCGSFTEKNRCYFEFKCRGGGKETNLLFFEIKSKWRRQNTKRWILKFSRIFSLFSAFFLNFFFIFEHIWFFYWFLALCQEFSGKIPRISKKAENVVYLCHKQYISGFTSISLSMKFQKVTFYFECRQNVFVTIKNRRAVTTEKVDYQTDFFNIFSEIKYVWFPC
jgi:hypothetical protein